MGLDAGKLRHTIVIEQQVPSINANGEQSIAWVRFATVYGAVEPLSAREFLTAQQVQSNVTARITIRYRPGLLPSMRFRHGGTIYNVAGVLPDNDSGIEWVTIPCSVGLNDG